VNTEWKELLKPIFGTYQVPLHGDTIPVQCRFWRLADTELQYLTASGFVYAARDLQLPRKEHQ